MLINLRNALMAGKRLPYDAEVEYLQSSGTQWIDTGLLGRDGYDFEYRFRPLNPLPCGIGGEYDNNKNCYIGLVRSNGNLAYNYSNPNIIVEVQSLTLGTDYNVKAHLYSGEQYFEVNGVRGGTGNRTGSFVSDFSLYVFAINSYNQPTSNASMRLYSLKIYLNGVLVRDYIPVRKGTVGYLYDRVSGKLFGNAGTGDFVLGPDVVPVEYIESHGTEWIDTGVLVSSAKLASGMRTELVASFTSTNTAQAMLKNNAPYYFVGVNASGLFYSGLGSTYSASNIANDTSVHKLILDSSTKQFSVDDVIATSYADTTGTKESNILLFGAETSASTMGFMCLAKGYSCKILESSALVRSLRPVRVGSGSTWEGAMIDTLTRRIYRNAGTGAFAYGNDLKYPIPAS